MKYLGARASARFTGNFGGCLTRSKLLICFASLIPALASATPVVFSTFPDTSVPESISLAPDGFASFGGEFFVTDATNNTATDAPGLIQVVPASGGAPTVFSSTPLNPRSGVFLPPGFGTYGGQFAVANFAGNTVAGIDGNANLGAITVFDSTGAQNTLYSSGNFFPASLAIAPAGLVLLAAT